MVVAQAARMREEFWGPYSAAAPSTLERRAKITALLSRAKHPIHDDIFQFYLPCGKQVCEGYYTSILGIRDLGQKRRVKAILSGRELFILYMPF